MPRFEEAAGDDYWFGEWLQACDSYEWDAAHAALREYVIRGAVKHLGEMLDMMWAWDGSTRRMIMVGALPFRYGIESRLGNSDLPEYELNLLVILVCTDVQLWKISSWLSGLSASGEYQQEDIQLAQSWVRCRSLRSRGCRCR
jgi:hypothetical protein